ncbi:MAG: hypothetical protein PHH60_05070 [Candidatus Margulisbacteria bacterium]|nr:hypothetical protein [Candidatus Margulisiibacteriota bacterium]
MIKKMRSKFVRTWLLIFALTFAVLAARFVFASNTAPTLEEVLARDGGKSRGDLSLVIASLLALSLATISVAKGYEIVRRSRPVAEAVLPEDNLKLEELVCLLDCSRQENERLKERADLLSSEAEELSRVEKLLRISNISLGKECERLRSENEMATLRVNSINMKPEVKTKKDKRQTLKRAKVMAKKTRGKK